MRRVVLDMDPGIDDAVALMLALNNPVLEVVAITIVSGNVSLRKGTANALRIVEALSKHVPVYMGASHPAQGGRPLHAESFHGADGLGDAGLAPPRGKSEKARASEMLVDLLKSSKRKEISIIATGPLTNIGLIVDKEPSLVKKLDQIIVMGGIYDPAFRGNVTEYSEFNFYFDPYSADRVMAMGMSGSAYPDITATGLDVTSHTACAVDTKTLNMICSIGGVSSAVACKILRLPILTYSYFNLHDVFALFAALYPEIFVTEKCSIRVAGSGNFKGRCTVISGKGNVRVCRKVNSARFNQLVLDGLK